MIHLVWSGMGFLVAVFVFGFSLIANLICNSVTGSGVYWDSHKWPFVVSLFVSALACRVAGRFYHRPVRVLLDPATGEEVVLRESHTFFFIPIVWWEAILVAGGVITLVVEYLK